MDVNNIDQTINERKDQKNEDDMIETVSYQFEKLFSPINRVFSSFGERKWIFTLKLKNVELEGIKKRESIYLILDQLNWKRIGDIYLSPKPYKYKEETHQIEILLNILKENNLIISEYYKIEIFCAFGSINPSIYLKYKKNN